MSELVTRFTALPNLHPALVHFPIALWPTAVLVDLVALWGRARGQNWFGRSAALLYGAAALGAGAAYWAGEEAADSLSILATEVQLQVNQHSDSALYTLWLLGIVAAARIGLEWWDRTGERQIPRLMVLLVAVGCVAPLFRTADLGGGLVYQHGVAVAEGEDSGIGVVAGQGSLPDRASPNADSESVMSRFVTGPDGVREWNPLSTDADAVGSILKPVEGSDPTAVSVIGSEAGVRGLALAVDGEAMLILPDTYGDVLLEAELAFEGFEGEAGLAHHVQSFGQAGTFTLVMPANEFVLSSVSQGAVRELDREGAEVSSDIVRMTVSAIGRHLRGLAGDRTVVHGHEPALPDGACGVLLRGEGTIRVLSIKVTPAGG